MLFIKYFIKTILVTFLLMSYQTASAVVVNKKCGEYIFYIKIKDISPFDKEFELSFGKKNEQKLFFYKTKDVVHLYTTCLKNSKNHELMLFQESYGGNAGPEDIYGIFDPVRKKMLIQPNREKGNEKQVQKLLGFPPPYLGDGNNKVFFCCFREQI